MTTEYEVRLDRDACEGIFACLVRDDRFREAADGLATIDGGDGSDDGGGGGDQGSDRSDGADGADGTAARVVSFSDDRLADARRAARACPVDAIDVVAPRGADDE